MTFWQKTFGGLNLQYYFRHFLFGLIFYLIIVGSLISDGKAPLSLIISVVTLCTVLQLLYPYSRFVYESIVNYLMGNNIIFGNIIFVITTKFATMALCWIFSPIIAPLGMIYLYFYYSKQEKMQKQTETN